MAASKLSPACLWRTTPELIVALQRHLSTPIDSYVNGSQVWLREDGPNEMTFEWRLHPVANYRRPDNMTTEEVFSTVAFGLASGDEAVPAPDTLWGGLECFPAFGDEIEPVILRNHAEAVLPVTPDACGLVDHVSVGNRWEQTRGGISLADELLEQLLG